MFYLANVCGCARLLLGLVEAILGVFGAGLCAPLWSGWPEDLQGQGFRDHSKGKALSWERPHFLECLLCAQPPADILENVLAPRELTI